MPKITSYGYSTQVNLGFEETVERLVELLKAEGFGVLTSIDVQAKMKEKLNKDMDKYVILGVCNPPLASQALDAEIEIGLLLPCNVIIYCKNGKTFVSTILPSSMMNFVNKKELTEVTEIAETKLKKVIDSLC